MCDINEKLLKLNRSFKTLNPLGVVVHSTATPGATAQNEFDYFNRSSRGASAHYFVDWCEIIRTIPEEEQAWHAGRTANQRFLSIEMCEPTHPDPEKFQAVWDKTICLLVDMCRRYGWTSEQIWSHAGVAEVWHETDHMDPHAYLHRYEKTWVDVLNVVDTELQRGGVSKMFNNLVIYAGDVDKRAAQYLADHLKAPIVSVDNVTPELLESAKNVYKVGGMAYDKATLIAGADRFDTVIKVIDFILKGEL